eukprot:gene3812-biopygen5732
MVIALTIHKYPVSTYSMRKFFLVNSSVAMITVAVTEYILCKSRALGEDAAELGGDDVTDVNGHELPDVREEAGGDVLFC